jgi:hypothetical protein
LRERARVRVKYIKIPSSPYIARSAKRDAIPLSSKPITLSLEGEGQGEGGNK